MKIVASVVMVIMFSVFASNTASAHPWHHGGGWYGPRVAVRVAVPVVRVATGYYGPTYAYDRPYVYRDRYNHRPYPYYRPRCEPHYYGHRRW